MYFWLVRISYQNPYYTIIFLNAHLLVHICHFSAFPHWIFTKYSSWYWEHKFNSVHLPAGFLHIFFIYFHVLRVSGWISHIKRAAERKVFWLNNKKFDWALNSKSCLRLNKLMIKWPTDKNIWRNAENMSATNTKELRIAPAANAIAKANHWRSSEKWCMATKAKVTPEICLIFSAYATAPNYSFWRILYS